MRSCVRATRLISEGQDRSLSWWERLALGIHLLGCAPCARFRRAVRWLRRVLSAPPVGVELPPEVRERLERALDRAAREG